MNSEFFLRFGKARRHYSRAVSQIHNVEYNQTLSGESKSQGASVGPRARIKFSKPIKLLAVTAALGIIDGLQAKYMTIGNLSETAAISYQVVFMLVAVLAAFFCLFNENWSPARNFSNLLLAIPVATLADNISIDVQALKPYFLLIPSNGYLWRIDVFGHTFLSPVAYWVNEQWLVPGMINGYATAVGIFVGFLTLQYFWARAGLDSRLPSWKPPLSFQRMRSKSRES